jgi:hypothetical protein
MADLLGFRSPGDRPGSRPFGAQEISPAISGIFSDEIGNFSRRDRESAAACSVI